MMPNHMSNLMQLLRSFKVLTMYIFSIFSSLVFLSIVWVYSSTIGIIASVCASIWILIGGHSAFVITGKAPSSDCNIWYAFYLIFASFVIIVFSPIYILGVMVSDLIERFKD